MTSKSIHFIFKTSILTILIALISRKIYIGIIAMDYVSKCQNEVAFEAMINDENFVKTVESFSDTEPKLIVIQNQHALNMTFNWLCNTQNMRGVHERTVIITIDEASKTKLDNVWPQLTKLHWPIECLKDPFNYGDGRYQLFYLFRSNLARTFLEFDKPFWMIQQDTFWRESLLAQNIETSDPSADIIFDRAAESNGNLIAGGYYLARPTCSSKAFFKQLSTDLAEFYAPDNTYMTMLCANKGLAKCGQIPFSMITNWIWLYEPNRFANVKDVPLLIQFDGDTKLGGKLGKMKSLGFYFVNSDGKTCNSSAVEVSQSSVLSRHENIDIKDIPLSYSHIQFGVYQWFIDQFYKSSITKGFLEKIIFPYAHYFMITL
uniref:Nucleotide-diphospho-sugar transferase domain-containing protein n=1 Tax=Panagrolaimus sp. ES5 TaxID=591445 RepID=A0AC34F8W2_9BILA